MFDSGRPHILDSSSITSRSSSLSSRTRSRSPSPTNTPVVSEPEQLEAPIVSSQPSSRSPSPAPHIVKPQLTIAPVQPYDPVMTSSDLRRRARATLVDVFRRYVISKLKTSLASPPRITLVKTPRRVQSFSGSEASTRRLRSVGSALTTRSSNLSLSQASMHVQCVSRSPSVAVLKSYESTVGVFRGRFDVHDNEEEDDDDEFDEEVEFGRRNEGGYVTWVTRSLLQRVEVEMREMRAVVRSMNARASARGLRIDVSGGSMQRSVGSRMGFSPIEGPLLSSISVSPPVSSMSGVIGEWEGVATSSPTLVDETPPFFDGFGDSFESEHLGEMEDIPLDDSAGEEAEIMSDGTSTETETDGSSVHTPSEMTSFDQVQIQSPTTPPLAEPTRGEYFSGVNVSTMRSSDEPSMAFDPPPLSSSPPRRPILTKQPPLSSRRSPAPLLPSQAVATRTSSPIHPSRSLTASRSQSPTSPSSPSALPLAAWFEIEVQ